MKKLAILLLALTLSVCLTAVCSAATGEELLKKAEMYLTFEDTYDDTNGNVSVEVDGDDPAFVEGKFGKAAAIRSGEGSLYTEDLKFETNSFTVTCWVNVHEHDSDPCLFANKDWNSGANPGFLLAIRGNDWKYNCNCDGGTRTDTEYPYDIANIGPMEDQWYHLALVVDREEQVYKLYVNGNPLTKGTSFADNGHAGVNYDDEWNEYPFYIGEDGTGFYNMGKLLNFEVDEFAVFFSALSEEDVVSVYTYAPEGYEAATVAEAVDLHLPLPEFSVDPKALLDTADVYLSFDDGITDAKGHAIRQEGEIETVDGISGKAVKIDSDKGHLAMDDYKFGADSFTVTAWLYTESSADDPCLFSNKDWGSSSNPGWLISKRGGDWRYAANSDGLEKVDKTFGYTYIPEDTFADTGMWYYMALVVDREAQTLDLYINGRHYHETAAFGVDHAGASYDTEYPFVIGEDGPEKYTSGSDGCSLVSLYDEIAIFKKALTGEEVAALYSINMQEEPAAEAPAEEPAPAEELAAEEPVVEEPAPAEEPAEEPAPAEEPTSKGFADMNAAANGKNVITAYTFVEGSNGFGGEGAENLWDGDTATKFCTNEFPVVSVAELDGVYTVNGFTMATANDNADYNGRSPSDWTISVSADGENWTELAKGDDSFFEETNFTYYAGDASAEGVSYVKLEAAASAANLFQVSELTLFGDKTADKTAETVDQAMDDKAEAPQTFDFGIIAAITAAVSLAGFAASKKHH